jgi:hypothetical protein
MRPIGSLDARAASVIATPVMKMPARQRWVDRFPHSLLFIQSLLGRAVAEEPRRRFPV